MVRKSEMRFIWKCASLISMGMIISSISFIRLPISISIGIAVYSGLYLLGCHKNRCNDPYYEYLETEGETHQYNLELLADFLWINSANSCGYIFLGEDNGVIFSFILYLYFVMKGSHSTKHSQSLPLL